MPAFRPDQVGPLYDFGLSTRDGSFLLCKDARGNDVEVTSMAYMCSLDKQRPMREATELQEKSTLIQFASSNLIDREFDQWPQVTQGDWSSGMGQRVFGTGGVTSQYWDGQGVMWPINDYLPQQSVAGPVIPLPADFTSFPYNGMAGGYVNNGGQGYAYVARLTTGASSWYVYFRTADAVYGPLSVVTPPDVLGIVHMSIGAGFIWILWSDYPQTTAFYITQVGIMGDGTFAVIRNDQTVVAAGRGAVPSGVISAAYVGNQLYVAVAQSSILSGTLNTWDNQLIVMDYSAPGAPTGVSVAFPSATVASGLANPGTSPFKFTDLNWQGSNLVISVSDGLNATVLTSAPPFTSVATSAILPGLANALLTSAGQTLFIVAATFGANTQVNRMDLFTLSGGTLIEIGPVTTPVAILDSVTSPEAFGGYAIWAVSYTLPGATTKTITVYAYDMVRGRLFRALTLDAASFTGSDVFGHDAAAVFGTTTRTFVVGATAQTQWGLALFTGLISANTETAREFYWGVQPLTPTPSFNGLLQMGVDLTSGLIDFTAASNKLYRQLLVTFGSGLILNQPTPSITVKVWFDQDPANLTTTPDVTKSISGSTAVTATGGALASSAAGQDLPTQLAVPLNRIARKIVYEVTSSGGGITTAGTWQQAPKLVSVAIQVATGWVWDLSADLSPNVKTNSAQTQSYAYDNQSQPGTFNVDNVVAYNFLRQLWRQKGGQVTLTMPNGDVYPALIQSETFDSPKPLAVSFRSDQKTTYQNVAVLKIREDI